VLNDGPGANRLLKRVVTAAGVDMAAFVPASGTEDATEAERA
jgi:hypothetical protein